MFNQYFGRDRYVRPIDSSSHLWLNQRAAGCSNFKQRITVPRIQRKAKLAVDAFVMSTVLRAVTSRTRFRRLDELTGYPSISPRFCGETWDRYVYFYGHFNHFRLTVHSITDSRVYLPGLNRAHAWRSARPSSALVI